METMLSAVFQGDGKLEVMEIPKPEIKSPTEVLIRVIAAGICGSDLHVLHVPPGQHADVGVVLGHEYYGEIEAIGEKVTRWKVGDKVVVDNIIKCHSCAPCENGRDNLCEHIRVYGQTINGGFAQYSTVESGQLHAMPDGIPSCVAAQTEPLSCVMNGMQKINPTPADNVLIYGMGPIGLTFVRVMKLYGVRNLAVCETSEIRRKKALECGASLAIDPSKEDIEQVLHREWGDGCDIVVDAVGAGPIAGQAVTLLNGGGTLLIMGQNANAMASIPPALVVCKELTIKGTYCAHNTFPVSIKLLQDPKLGLDQLVSHRLELKDINHGIELLRSQQASRVVIYPNGIVD